MGAGSVLWLLRLCNFYFKLRNFFVLGNSFLNLSLLSFFFLFPTLCELLDETVAQQTLLPPCQLCSPDQRDPLVLWGVTGWQ